MIAFEVSRDLAMERLKEHHFSDYLQVFIAICSLSNSRRNIDTDEIAFEISGKVPDTMSMVSEIEDSATAYNLEPYIKMLTDHYKRHGITQLCGEITGMASDPEELDPDEILKIIDTRVCDIYDEKTASEPQYARELLSEAFASIEDVMTGRVVGMRTGFKTVDSILQAGFLPGDLAIIAARPGMGKTSLALSIAQNNKHLKGALFSLEMPKSSMIKRMLSIESGVDLARIFAGTMTKTELENLSNAASKISEWNFIIDDTPGIDYKKLRAKVKRLVKKERIKYVMIDYLQLMSGVKKNQERRHEIEDISRELKSIAKENNIPVISLAQLSRSVENRSDKRPQLSDLRESGGIEQDADIVLFIYRPPTESVKKGDFEIQVETDNNLRMIIVEKQRNGATGLGTVYFDGPTTRFYTKENTEVRDFNN